MGVIQRQTFKNNIVSYLAVVVGAVAQLTLYADAPGLKGQADAMLKFVFLLGPLVGFGSQAIVVRFLPYVEGDKKSASQQLFTRAFVLTCFNLLILALLHLLFGEMFFGWLETIGVNLGKLATDFWSIFLLLIPVSLSVMVTAHILNFHRIAVPAVFNNLLAKLLLPLLFGLIFLQVLPEDLFIPFFIGIYWLILFGLMVYAFHLNILGFKWGKLQLNGKRTKDLISLGAFTLFGGIGSVLATHLDTIFVNTIIDDVFTQIYSFAIFTTAVIAIPFRAVNGIASPIVSRAWKENDMAQLRNLYRDTAMILFCAGAIIFTGIAVCLPYVYQLTAKTTVYTAGFTATIFLGVAQLFDQMTSINGTLITYTDNYRWNLVFIMVLGGCNVFLNYYFMVDLDLGLAGAGLATMTSLLAYNLLKVAFVYRRMHIHPFSFPMLNVIALIGVAYLAGHYAPDPGNVIVNIGYRGLIVVAVFYLAIRYTSAVPIARSILKGGLKEVLK